MLSPSRHNYGMKSDGEEDEQVSPSETFHASSGSCGLYHHEWTYEIDLQLAAELGKSLLQRNKELESNLTSLQYLADDQALQIDYLTKQVQLLRDESNTRLANCEMLESQLTELKRSEVNLKELRNLDYMRIARLQDTVEVLQSRTEELQTNLTEIKRKNWEDKFANNSTVSSSGPSGMVRSISHGDALKSAKPLPASDDEGETDPETNILRAKIKVLQRQVADERKQRELLQDQVVNVSSDNTSLWQQLDHVTKEAAVWREKLETVTAKYAEEIQVLNEQREKDVEEQPEICRETQLSILDEIADSLRDRFLDDFRREQEENEPEKVDMVESEHAKVKSKTTQTDAGLIINYLADPTEGRFQRGPPEYKKLFKEIFEIIKKSQEEDANHAAQSQRSRGQKQKKQIIHYHNQF